MKGGDPNEHPDDWDEPDPNEPGPGDDDWDDPDSYDPYDDWDGSN